MILPPRPSRRDFVKAWLDDRTGIPSALASLMNQPIPGGANFWHALGAAAALLVGLEFVTGILLAFYYAPSAATAWASTAYIQDQLTLGWFIRGLHSFGSVALIVVSGLHLLAMVLLGAYKKPREMNWVIGLVLMLLLVAFAISGYGLPWDQAGYWAKLVESSIVGTTPIVGPMLERLLQGGSRYGNYTVVHIYALHVFVLPAVLSALLALHIGLAIRHKATPPWHMDPALVAAQTEPYYPGQALRDLTLFATALVVVSAAVIVRGGAALEPPADGASNYMARPEWYAIPLYQLRHYFNGPMEIIATTVIPGIVGGIVFALPFWDRSPHHSPAKRPVVMLGMLGGLLGLASLSVLAIRKDAADESFQRQRVEIRAEAARARELAQRGVLPSGGLAVFQNDPQYEVIQLYKEKCGNCHGTRGQGGDEGPDFYDYNSRDWLLGYLKDPQGHLYMGPAKKNAAKAMKPVSATDEELMMLTELIYAQTGAPDVNKDLVAKAEELDLFSEKDCDSCHFITDEDKDLGNAGPNLFHRGMLDYVVRLIEAPDHETMYGEKAKMPGFAGKLTPEQIRSLAAYVMSLRKAPEAAAK